MSPINRCIGNNALILEGIFKMSVTVSFRMNFFIIENVDGDNGKI